mmetsp:Transcript_21581/g.66299  ORF Transcript_21581/g.66299 Transcript_21581/m.66299 type:complete len:259 (-) Transcript_21581:611-1387(-)
MRDALSPGFDVRLEPVAGRVSGVLSLADGRYDGLELTRFPLERFVEMPEVRLFFGDLRVNAGDERVGPQRARDAGIQRFDVVFLRAAFRPLRQRERVHFDLLEKQVWLVPIKHKVLCVRVAPQNLVPQTRMVEHRVIQSKIADRGLEPRRRPERGPHEDFGALGRRSARFVRIFCAHGRQPAAVDAFRPRPHVDLALRPHRVRDVRRAVARRHGVPDLFGVGLDRRIRFADARRDVRGRVELLIRRHAVEVRQHAGIF